MEQRSLASKTGLQPVGGGLVGAEDPEVAGLRVHLHDVAQELRLHARGLRFHRARLRDLHRVLAEVGQAQVAQEEAPVGVGVGPHPARPFRREVLELGVEAAGGVEELLRTVAPHPLLQDPHVGGVALHLAHGHLVGAERALGALAVDLAWPRPALGRAQDDHRPPPPLLEPGRAGFLLDVADLRDHVVEGRGHERVHHARVVALHEVRLVAVAAEERFLLVSGNPREHRGPGDLPAVQVEDGEDGAVPRGVQELVGVPARGERTRLRLSVAHHAGHDEVGVVECGAVGVGEGVAELASFVDGARGLRGHVARDPSGEGELLEETPHSFLVHRDVGVDLAVGPLQVRVRDEAGAAVARSRDVDHVEVLVLDDAVQVHVHEVEPGGRPPVPEEARLDVVDDEGLPQQRVVEQVDLADGEVVRRAPPRVHAPEEIGFRRDFLVLLHAAEGSRAVRHGV